MTDIRNILAALLFFCLCMQSAAQEENFAPMFPFQPTHSAPDNITNVSKWTSGKNPEAGAEGFITARGDHFVDNDGHTRRFLGTNICFTGCFPSHEDADRVAEELTRYGINLVRLHYVHHAFPPGKVYADSDSFIEPQQLEKFDYFFSALKKRGIYTYFQLNIARKFNANNGFENAEKLPFYNNGVDNFDAHMINLQKKFHSDILNHKNPYTGLRYKEDPGIAMMELSNENSIIYTWFSSKHRMPSLVEPYATDLKTMWNDFLKSKYADDAALKEAWLSGLDGDGHEYIADGIITAPVNGSWGFQQDGMSKSEMTLLEASPKDNLKGSHFIRLSIDAVGATPNMPQFYRSGLKFTSMSPMCLKLKMRADRVCDVTVRFSQNHSPWQVAGLQSTVTLGRKWKEYEFNFTSNMDDNDVRLIISHFVPCQVEIADISCTSGMHYTWPRNESMKAMNISWPSKNEWSLLPQRAMDFTEFLSTVELNYFRHLRSTLKNYIKPHQPFTGTQLHYGLNLPQAEMDFCDYHCYWTHPTFRGTWGEENCVVRDRALANGDGFPGSNLATASRSRVLGKPFTISEFDHPNLNPYSAEGNLMAAAQGAFQNWSAIIQFAWSHNTDFYRTVQNVIFDMCSATQKLVHLPACYSMFVRGDVRIGTADTVYVQSHTAAQEIQTIARNQNTVSPSWERNNMIASLTLAYPSGRQVPECPRLFNTMGRTVLRKDGDIPQSHRQAFENKEITNSTGELVWNWQIADAGYFKVDSRATKVFTGYVRGRSFEYGGMTLIPGRSRMDWITLSLTKTQAVPSSQPTDVLSAGTYLLAATGVVHNTGAKILDIGSNNLSCSSALGGSKGTGPVLCEGIDADIVLKGLAGRVECFALDPEGEVTSRVDVRENVSSDAVLHIEPKYRTVWYKLVIK